MIGERHTRLLASALTVVALIGAGCSSGDDSEAQTTTTDAPELSEEELPAPGLVDAAEAFDLTRSDVTVIDVRTPEEFGSGRLPGAQVIDIYQDDFAEQIEALDPTENYLVYCRSGNRSSQAVALMNELGFERVWDLDGGILAYEAADLPVIG